MKHKLILILGAAISLPLGAHGQASEPSRPEPFRPTARPAPAPAPAPAADTPEAPPRTGPTDPFSRPVRGPFAAELVAGRSPGPVPRANQPGFRTNLSVRYEVFSLDLAAAASLMRAGHPDQQLYTAMLSLIEQEKCVQENLTILSLLSGQRASNSSITETIYPTEYDKPNIPTAYETRNIGLTLEAEAIPNPQNQLIELSVAPEHVTQVGTSNYGPPDAQQEMPEFESQRLNTTTQVTPDVPRLLGTITPHTKLNKDAAKRIWFAFVTVSHVK